MINIRIGVEIGLAFAIFGYPLRAAAPQDAIATQQTAVSAMQDSIAKQRASVQKQLGQSAGSFFNTAPPAHMEGVNFRGEPFDSFQPRASAECPQMPESEVRSLAGKAATREGLDAELLLKVMRQESDFKPCAVSVKGAMGLMQLMPATAGELGVKDSFDPVQNIDAGARLLHQLLTRYNGDVLKAVSAYNAGPARVDAADGIPQIPETIDYINRIFQPAIEKH